MLLLDNRGSFRDFYFYFLNGIYYLGFQIAISYEAKNNLPIGSDDFLQTNFTFILLIEGKYKKIFCKEIK